MNVTEAQNITNGKTSREHDQLLESVYRSIQNAAMQGQWLIIVTEKITSRRNTLVDTLRNDGFTVNTNLPDHDQIRVKWNLA